MDDYNLNNIDSDDINDLLLNIEKSFSINFKDNELTHITNFGQLCDIIKNKIQLDNSGGCSSQQAFYKLRDAICVTLDIERNEISTNSTLINIVPRKNRRSQIKKIENYLDIQLHILRPPYWLTGLLNILLFSSFVGLFFTWEISLPVFLLSCVGFWLSLKMGNVLELQTVGQVAEKMTRNHYLKSRRNPNTVNIEEIEKVIIDLFSVELDLHKSTLTREATF